MNFRQQVQGTNRQPGVCARSRRNAQAAAATQLFGSQLLNVVATNADYTCDGTEDLLLVAGQVTPPIVTLADMDDLPEGYGLWIKNTSSSDNVTVNHAAGDTFDQVGGGTSLGPLAQMYVVTGDVHGGIRTWVVLEAA